MRIYRGTVAEKPYVTHKNILFVIITIDGEEIEFKLKTYCYGLGSRNPFLLPIIKSLDKGDEVYVGVLYSHDETYLGEIYKVSSIPTLDTEYEEEMYRLKWDSHDRKIINISTGESVTSLQYQTDGFNTPSKPGSIGNPLPAKTKEPDIVEQANGDGEIEY